MAMQNASPSAAFYFLEKVMIRLTVESFIKKENNIVFCKYCNKDVSNFNTYQIRSHVGAHHKEVTNEFGKISKEEYTCQCGRKKIFSAREYFHNVNKRIFMCKSCLVKKIWQNPIHRNNQIIKRNSLETRTKLSIRSKAAWKNPACFQKLKTFMYSESGKLRKSQNSKRMWTNQEYAFKMLNLTSSKGEKEIKHFLQEHFPKANWTSGGRHFIGMNNNEKIFLAFDCYSKNLKTIVEYDGILHFITSFKDKTPKIEPHLKDKLLEEWCKQNGWRLIRISESYYKKDSIKTVETLKKLIYENKEQIIKIGEEYKQFQTNLPWASNPSFSPSTNG